MSTPIEKLMEGQPGTPYGVYIDVKYGKEVPYEVLEKAVRDLEQLEKRLLDQLFFHQQSIHKFWFMSTVKGINSDMANIRACRQVIEEAKEKQLEF